MARVSTALTNFTGGQLSDRMEGRTDFQKYFSGCKTRKQKDQRKRKE